MKQNVFSSPESVHELGLLRDLYGELLPKRQRQVIHLKLDEDLSLSEISERLGISRQACEDALKRCVNALRLYEKKLGFLERIRRQKRHIEKTGSLLREMDARNWNVNREMALECLQAMEAGGEVTKDGI
ncbi:MAG TPA: winged helix-turn-helix transcriptional regulator [Firmicutes bacterium]|nr:winged helix-turn-helix transcriptional regulator [Candidatus Fermentithermobacillaceae bacterium]